MTWHVVCLAGRDDTFMPSLTPTDHTIIVPFGDSSNPHAPHNLIPGTLAAYGLEPTPNAADFLHAALAAYTADTRIARRNAYDNWTRDIILHLAVRDITAWDSAAAILQRLLCFLTGDHWTVSVRPAPASYKPDWRRLGQATRSIETQIVCLFSGGLDSFIGAVDQLEAVGQVILIGHHSLGGGPTSTAQHRAIGSLRSTYSADQAPFVQCWFSPPKGMQGASEITTRGRSILFLGLGVAAASALRTGRLIIPENGFISLNVPLTSSRLGSFSTRTTHPHLMALTRDILTALGVQVDLSLPYRFMTKAEMISQCSNQEMIVAGLNATMSCSHPGVGRFTGGGHVNQHCGYCIPCLIRRAAVHESGSEDPTVYTWEDLRQAMTPTRASDLRALRMALDHYRKTPPVLADLLLAGPLPHDSSELAAYVDVYRRGVMEIHRFLDTRLSDGLA